jgi:LDH2 family malate/lactate/ureidoglycolate dehydrogenase
VGLTRYNTSGGQNFVSAFGKVDDVTGERIPFEQLLDFVACLFMSSDVPADDARLLADTLVQADLWGHESHGVLRAPWYMARLKSGAMKARTDPKLCVDAGAVALWDGQDGAGQVLAAQAMRDAIGRAKAHGIAAVGVRNSNHFGTAMYYTRMAAIDGCVAFLSTNASPAMAPWGGRTKMVGTNPWSIAAPGGSHPPMMLDIANTGVARGKIYLAKQKGQTIPPNWAMTADGAPTTDAASAIAGIVLPMAEHKGYAIAVMMDVLSGLLTGSSFGSYVNGPSVADKRSGCGHLMIVLDIAAFQKPSDFSARIDQLIGELKSSPLAQGFDEVFYPGEIEARNDAKHRQEGLSLPVDTVRDLEKLAQRQGIAPPF